MYKVVYRFELKTESTFNSHDLNVSSNFTKNVMTSSEYKQRKIAPRKQMKLLLKLRLRQ